MEVVNKIRKLEKLDYEEHSIYHTMMYGDKVVWSISQLTMLIYGKGSQTPEYSKVQDTLHKLERLGLVYSEPLPYHITAWYCIERLQ